MVSSASNSMPVTFDVAMEIASHEAIVREAYLDAAGVWTWSVGLTSATGHVVERYRGKPQSLAHCLRVYVWALDNYAHAVRETFKARPLSETQFAAALSFHWNTGSIEKATWAKLWLAGKDREARASLLKAYIRAGGKTNNGLIDRRKREAALFFDGKWTHRGNMVEYQVQPNGKINWGSMTAIKVEAELRAAMAGDIPASDKVITEVKTPPPAAAVTVTGGGVGTGALLAADPLAKGLEVLTTQQGEVTSGDLIRIGVAVVIIGGSMWFAWRQYRNAATV